MKTLVVLTCLFLSVNAPAATKRVAQPLDSQLAIGFEGGLNIANMSSNTDATAAMSKSSLLGVAAGIFFELRLLDGLYIQPEILYVQKGVKMSTTATILTLTQTTEIKTAIDYFDIPILARVNYALGALNLYALTGPFIGIKTSASKTADSSINGGAASSTTVELANVKSMNYGFDFGIGADYRLDTTWFVGVNARYGLGLANIDSVATKTNDFLILTTLGYAL